MTDERREYPTLTLTVNGSAYRLESEALEGSIGGAKIKGRWNDKGGLDLDISFPRIGDAPPPPILYGSSEASIIERGAKAGS